jgi:CYTH domain-containing protein
MEEIEHKYLVDHVAWKALSKPPPVKIVQGFISRSPESIVRIRIKGNKGFIAIKGKSVGITRSEFEYEIPLQDAEDLLNEFTDKQIRKQRYEIQFRDHIWEVDVFEGPLKGLILAEIEVKSEEEKFDLPYWVSEDVSRNPDYYNSVLIEKC